VSTQQEVEVSYDVDNDFFRLWLDEAMNYTCAIWEDSSTLEEAQLNKLRILCDFAHVQPGSRVLDIGCGWGAALQYLVGERDVAEAHGITLSSAQIEEIESRRLPRVTASLESYADYSPPCQFDAVLSICMIEHVATPQQARRGEHIAMYRDYFRRVHEWTLPGARFGLQVILRDRIPRDRDDLRDIHWFTHHIFPGGLSLRLEDLVRSVAPYWEIMEIHTRREHYRRTMAAWAERFDRNADLIRERWGPEVFEDYSRYLHGGVRAFDRRYQSLAQVALRRVDGVGGRAASNGTR
jgi:cyclopropane-fatty-acyl-phospholipid synthase